MSSRPWHQQVSWANRARLDAYSCSAIAKSLGIGLRQLERHFHGVHRLHLHGWAHDLRMRDAAYLLGSSSRIGETAMLLGYKSLAQFSRDFRRHYGRSPSRFSRRGAESDLNELFLIQYVELIVEAVLDNPQIDRQLRPRLPAHMIPRRDMSRFDN